jgi:hypothetical protein
MSEVMMRCGHAANAVDESQNPVCAVCVLLTPLARIVDDNPPALIGREAKCYCGMTVPSSTDLPFFEYQGPGSVNATENCAKCEFTIRAHAEVTMFGRKGITDHVFTPHGPYEFDNYYCGHDGWN